MRPSEGNLKLGLWLHHGRGWWSLDGLVLLSLFLNSLGHIVEAIVIFEPFKDSPGDVLPIVGTVLSRDFSLYNIENFQDEHANTSAGVGLVNILVLRVICL